MASEDLARQKEAHPGGTSRGSGAARPERPWMCALGRAEMPASFTLDGVRYRHRRTFKHDFLAATGLYDAGPERVILKLGRSQPLFGLPMRWLGRALTEHEARVHERVRDLEAVPRVVGRLGATGLVREFADGHPLQKGEWVSEAFLDELSEIVDAVHARRVAYNDLHKRENVLVGPDGRPRLIDFQVSLRLPRSEVVRGPLAWPLRFAQAQLFAADRHHVLKHRRRHRPDTMTREAREAARRRGPLLRLLRRALRPWKLARRFALERLTGAAKSRKQQGPEFRRPLGADEPPPRARRPL